MKKESHPPYQKVLFIDSASGHRFICGSTMQTDSREKFEGVEYPVVYLSISSSSHPFFTGSKQLVDSEGRVEKFNKRFARKTEVISDDSSSSEGSEKEPESAAKKPAGKKTAKAPKKGS